MKVDMVLGNGRFFICGKLIKAYVGIKDGKIVYISKLPLTNEYIDLKGMIVIPGGIDGDCHLRIPGLEHKEDFLTGTSAAAAGGITTVLDMPNNKPPITTIERLKEKNELVKNDAVVDYGLHFGGAVDNLGEIKELIPGSIPSVKYFLAGHATTPTTVSNLGILYEHLYVLGEKEIPASLHAQDQTLLNYFSEKLKHRTDFTAYHESGNSLVTASSVSQVLEMCLYLLRKYNINPRVHFCHVTTRRELEIIKNAKAIGLNWTCAVAPYTLFLDKKDVEELKGYGKVSPSLKSEGDRQALWEGIKNNVIDIMTSEHSPHTKEEKEMGGVWDIPAGMPGLETMLPLLFYKELPIEKIVKLMSERPAAIFGVQNKGVIAEGYDADLVVLNPKKPWVVKGDELYAKSQWSVFDGWELKGKSWMTVVRGEIVYKDEQILKTGHGRNVYLEKFERY